MTTTHHTPHVDAGKDPGAVRAALDTITRQMAAILKVYGVPAAVCEDFRRDVGVSVARAMRLRRVR